MNNKLESKRLMLRYFPNWRTFPKNSLTPLAVNYPAENVTIICFLALTENDIDEELAEEFQIIGVGMCSETNQNGKDDDLIIQLTKYNPEKGDIALKAIIPGYDNERQKAFCRSLKNVEEIFLFTSNNDGRASSVKQYRFDHKFYTIIDKFLEAN